MADKDFKPEQVSPSSLIQPGSGSSNYRSFASMRSAADLGMLEASAPAYHGQVLRALKASGTVRDDGSHTELERHPVRRTTSSYVLPTYRTGAPAITNKGVKVTIIHANAGHTKNSHIPVHRVADKKGETWLEKESNLKLRM